MEFQPRYFCIRAKLLNSQHQKIVGRLCGDTDDRTEPFSRYPGWAGTWQTWGLLEVGCPPGPRLTVTGVGALLRSCWPGALEKRTHSRPHTPAVHPLAAACLQCKSPDPAVTPDQGQEEMQEP